MSSFFRISVFSDEAVKVQAGLKEPKFKIQKFIDDGRISSKNYVFHNNNEDLIHMEPVKIPEKPIRRRSKSFNEVPDLIEFSDEIEHKKKQPENLIDLI